MCNACVAPDAFLPTQNKSRPEKKKRLPHPFQGMSIRKNGNGYCANLKQKDVRTQFLSSPEFLENISNYVSDLSQEDCCVSTRDEARKCKCIQFLADKPSIVKLVALGLQKHFDLDESNKKLQLVNEQRQADRLTRFCKSLRMYQLPLFVDQFTGNKTNDFH